MTNLTSKIEWTDSTWNVVTGCTKVSPGCDHCYAETLTERFHGKGSFAEVKLHHDRLDAPLRWRKPRRVFVNSMSDLFHDSVPSAFIARVFGVMRDTPHHTYQILTKRHGRMCSLMRTAVPGERWPLSNVHLGVSVEDQKRAELRVSALEETSASVRFLSCEPLLGPVDLTNWMPAGHARWTCSGCRRLYAGDLQAVCPGCGRENYWCGSNGGNGRPNGQPISWVIVGGESGRGARSCDPEWVRSLVNQCQAAGVPVFVKQLGSVWARQNGADSKGGNPDYWPEDLRIRQFPDDTPARTAVTS